VGVYKSNVYGREKREKNEEISFPDGEFPVMQSYVLSVLKEGATCYLVILSDTYALKSMATSLGTGQKTTCNELF